MVFSSANEAWVSLMASLVSEGMRSAPRGQQTLELLHQQIVIENPHDNIVYHPARALDISYAVGELLWYMSGSNSLEHIMYYSKFWEKISDDGATSNSAYGYRIFNPRKFGFSQYDQVVEKLRNDPDSRQAIISIKVPSTEEIKDVPCTLTLQFFIRHGKLNLQVNMRSNDIILGFPYDVYCFTSIQQFMANELGVSVGRYVHNVGSLHLYTKNITSDMSKKLNEHCDDIPANIPFSIDRNDLAKLQHLERILRTTSIYLETSESYNVCWTEYVMYKNEMISQYAKDMATVLMCKKIKINRHSCINQQIEECLQNVTVRCENET